MEPEKCELHEGGLKFDRGEYDDLVLNSEEKDVLVKVVNSGPRTTMETEKWKISISYQHEYSDFLCVSCGDSIKTAPVFLYFYDKTHEPGHRQIDFGFHEKCEEDFKNWLNNNNA